MKIVLALVLAGPMMAQQGEEAPKISGSSFKFDHAGVQPSSYAVDLSGDGTGTYVAVVPEGTPPVNRKLVVGPQTLRRIYAGYGTVAKGSCETKLPNVAKTGAKRVGFRIAERAVECEFNYSDDAALNDAASAFQAIAETMQAGERLKWKKRFDHLGLDAELDGLVGEVKSGFAIELQNIAPVLRSIAEDEEFLATSRRKAQGLLAMVGPVEKKS